MGSECLETPYGEFAADFISDRLNNLCEPEVGIQTGPFGSQLHQEDYVEFGTPIITVEHLGENRILHVNTPKVSDADRNRLSRYRLQRGDIVFSRVGSVDRRALVRQAEDGWLFSGRCLRVRPDPQKINSEYLSYFFGLPAFQEHIRAIAVGATMPSLNTKLLSDIVVPYPPSIDEQRAIGRILGSLDDRIDHNRALAAKLEAIARRLFKSWFVDFDPVRAKAAGEKPVGLADDLAALFPDRFEDSELGEIPEGWKVRTIADLAEIVGGSTPSTKNDSYWVDGQHCWATPKDLAGLSSPVLLSTERKVTDAGLDQISSGLLPPGTVLLSSRAPIGYLAIASVPVAINQGFIAMKPKIGVSNLYLLYWAEASHEAIVANANGSTFLEISKKNFRPIPAIDPGHKVMAAFDSVVSPLFDRIVCAEQEIATLTQLRDLLLPRLISGKLRVGETEAMLEEALA